MRREDHDLRTGEAGVVQLVERLAEQLALVVGVAVEAHHGVEAVVGPRDPAGLLEVDAPRQGKHARRVAAVDREVGDGGARAAPLQVVEGQVRGVKDRLVGEVAEDAEAALGEPALEAQLEHVEVALAEHVLALVEDELVEGLSPSGHEPPQGAGAVEEALEGGGRQFLLPEGGVVASSPR